MPSGKSLFSRIAPLLVGLWGCGAAVHTGSVEAAPALECLPGDFLALAPELHRPGQGCDQADAIAADNLESMHYRKACQAASPSGSLPLAVQTARVASCRPDSRGAFFDVEVCCPTATAPAPAPEQVRHGDPLVCPAWQSPALVTNLHDPQAESCPAMETTVGEALASFHYRKACKNAAPRSAKKPEVAAARVVKCRSGGDAPGVSIDVSLCCDARVLEEKDFRKLVWGLTPEQVLANLSEPRQITVEPPYTHWRYPLEVARGQKVFSEVTVSFVNGRIDAYTFH